MKREDPVLYRLIEGFVFLLLILLFFFYAITLNPQANVIPQRNMSKGNIELGFENNCYGINSFFQLPGNVEDFKRNSYNKIKSFMRISGVIPTYQNIHIKTIISLIL